MLCIRSLKLRLMGREPGKLCSSQPSGSMRATIYTKNPKEASSKEKEALIKSSSIN